MNLRIFRYRFLPTSAIALVGAAALFFLQSDSFSLFGPAKGGTTPGAAVALDASSEQGKPQAFNAPEFSLLDAKGKTVRLSSLKGKVVVINFWATWCGPCRAEIPGFLEVYNKYKSKGLEIIGISLDKGGWQDVKPFIGKFNIAYPVVLGTREVVLDYGGITGIPTTFIVDRKGNVVSGHVGYFPKGLFETEIKKVL